MSTARYFKSDRRAKFDLPLWKIAIEEHLPINDAMWKCRGVCYRSDMRDPPLTKHVKLAFPSGLMYYVCYDCGASVLFETESERIIDECPEHKRLLVIEEFNKLKKEDKEKVIREHKGQTKRNKKTKKGNKDN